uniref:Ly49-like N-terminal domain-containing protein n=1 Tax=Oryctolagus cuniculus TaxID=9986 RepID=A0A5F9DLC3_RABIT
MSHQEETYSALRFPQSSSESQNRLRPDGTRRCGKTDYKEFSVPWHLIAVILGTLCLLLSVMVRVLEANILQLIQEKHQQQEILGNLTQMYHVVQNDDYLNKQLLANKSLEYDTLKNKTLLMENALKSLFLKWNGCNAKKDTFPKSVHNPGKVHEDYWSCYGVNCYYFVLQDNTWEKCKQTCQSYGSSLLKIDNEHELVSQTPPCTLNLMNVSLPCDPRGCEGEGGPERGIFNYSSYCVGKIVEFRISLETLSANKHMVLLLIECSMHMIYYDDD